MQNASNHKLTDKWCEKEIRQQRKRHKPKANRQAETDSLKERQPCPACAGENNLWWEKRKTCSKWGMEGPRPQCHLGSLITVIGLKLVSWAQNRSTWLQFLPINSTQGCGSPEGQKHSKKYHLFGFRRKRNDTVMFPSCFMQAKNQSSGSWREPKGS